MTLDNIAALNLSPGLIIEQFSYSQGIYFFLDFSSLCPTRNSWLPLTIANTFVWEDPLEKEMATHYSILAWEIPQTGESGGPQSMGLQRVRHKLVTKQQ